MAWSGVAWSGGVEQNGVGRACDGLLVRCRAASSLRQGGGLVRTARSGEPCPRRVSVAGSGLNSAFGSAGQQSCSPVCRRMTNTARRGARQSSVWRSREALSERRARERRRSGARPAPLVAAGAILGQTAARQPPHGRRAFRPLRLPALRQRLLRTSPSSFPSSQPVPTSPPRNLWQRCAPRSPDQPGNPQSQSPGRSPGSGRRLAARGARGSGLGRRRQVALVAGAGCATAVTAACARPRVAASGQPLHQQLRFVGL